MEAPQLAFTPEQIAERGQDNFQHVLFGTIAYLKARGFSVEDWATFLGTLFAPGWGHGHDARAFMEKAALNVVSAGGSLRSISGNEDWAESVVGDWPPDGKLASERFHHFFGLTQEDVDPFWEIFGPIGEYLGFEYHWYRETEQKLSFTFTRKS
jgi:hypothetical protein